MLTPNGIVKVLDFGLARTETTPAVPGDSSHSPTMTVHADATEAGMILGTAAYMSPEQARGRPVDRRGDVWSFGCVLYECLAGRPIFTGETTSDLIARILEREPDWTLALPDFQGSPQVPGGPRGSFEEQPSMATVATHQEKVAAVHLAASDGRPYDAVLAEVVGRRRLNMPGDDAA